MKSDRMIAGGLLALLAVVPLGRATEMYVEPTGVATANTDYDIMRLVDGTGLSDDSLVQTGSDTDGSLPTHSTSAGDMWRTKSGYDWSGGAVVTFELGTAYDLTGMHIWNYNENWSGGEQSYRGVKNAMVEYQAGDTNWITYADNMEFAEATSSSAYTGEEYTFDSTLMGVTAVRFTCTTNWAEDFSDRIGLAEVRFTAAAPDLPMAPNAKKLWINGTTAKLYWDAGAGATSYSIKRSETEGTNYMEVATTAELEYWDSGLVAGQTYYYVIAGINTGGEGDVSSELSGTAADFSILSDGGGSWGSSIYTLPESVFDGDTSTYYDGASSTAWTGIDVGEGNDRICPAIEFYPRSTHASRMNGAEFQGSVDGSSWVTLASVTETPDVAWNRIYTGNFDAYRYFRCNGASYGNMAELRFLTTDDVDDVIYMTSPSDGDVLVSVNTSNIVVTATDIGVELISVLDDWKMLVNEEEVVSDMSFNTNGVNTFTYTPETHLEYGTDYSIQLKVYRIDGITNSIDFTFTTSHDPEKYLIAPDIRNGGFEYVNGEQGNTSKITDFDQVDNWVELVAAGKAGTGYAVGSPQGTRYLDTDRYFQVCNITDHIIQEGDILQFEWEMADRPAGVIVSLCYTNDVEAGVTSIVDSEVTVPDSASIYHEWSGIYIVEADDPSIGSTLGLLIQDNGNNPTNDTSTTEAHVDYVRLHLGDTAIQSVWPEDGAVDVAGKPTVQVVLAEGLDQIDADSIVLMIDGRAVTPDAVVDADSKVIITYTPAEALSRSIHEVSISASGLGSGEISQVWSFEVAEAVLVAPVLGSISVSDGVDLSWDSVLGVDYYIMSTTNLITGPWVTNIVVSGSGTTISTNLIRGAQSEEFFRLKAE